MFARRHFLHKRSQNGAHLAARESVTIPFGQPNMPSSPSPTPSDAKSTDTPTPPTPVVPAPQTTASPATSPSPTFPFLSTPTPSSRSSSTPTPTSTLGSSASTSSASTASSILSTPLMQDPTPTTHGSSPTRADTSASFTLTSSPSPSTTSTGSSGGTNTSAIVGGIAGTLVGIAVLGFLLMWCMRRQRNRDVDDFDAQAFKRQSAVLLDDPVEPPRSYNPRPPTMIEHHNVSPALAAQAGSHNFYGSYGGYGQQPPYASPDMIQPTTTSPPQAYGAPPMGYGGYNEPQQQIARQPSNVGYAGYDPQQRLARQPSNATYLTRQPSSAVGYAPPAAPPGSLDPNAHYIDLSRSSISPYQAVQYADISRQLGATDSNAQVSHESTELPDDLLPSPFDDPAGAAPAATSSHVHLERSSKVAMPGPVTAISAPHTQANTTGAHERPATIYQDGDAYGGI